MAPRKPPVKKPRALEPVSENVVKTPQGPVYRKNVGVRTLVEIEPEQHVHYGKPKEVTWSATYGSVKAKETGVTTMPPGKKGGKPRIVDTRPGWVKFLLGGGAPKPRKSPPKKKATPKPAGGAHP